MVIGFDAVEWDADIDYMYVRIQKINDHECGAV
jgi:hypothetical protein